MAQGGPVRAFLSYAHEDHTWRDALLGQLGWLTNSDQLDLFVDPQIAPGQPWDGRIKAELHAAEIVFFLVSGHFFKSSYCIKAELLPGLDRHARGQCDVVAVLCDLAGTPLGPLQCLPKDPQTNRLKPLKDWHGRTDRALAPVVAQVRGLVATRQPTLASLSGDLPPVAAAPAGIPPLGRFVGREGDLDQLRTWILQDIARPIVLLGPGGAGKSKLTIAALRDRQVAKRFSDRRLFVRLEDVRDEPGIYSAVARELGVESGPKPFADALAALGDAPTLITLDNAETPWEADVPGAEQAFARLAELPAVTLVASLRGYEEPGVADWRPILVEALPTDPARALFLAIAGERFVADPALSTLLARLDGLPLAIELVAHRAQAEPDAATVLRRWDEEKSSFLRRGQGGRKDLDLAVSIALSLSSPRMTDFGRRLFALLGRLPHGLAATDLADIMPGVGAAAAAALRATGLVLRDTERLRMLAPTRELACERELLETDAGALVRHYIGIADDLPNPGSPSFASDAARRARAELPNIEAILPKTVARSALEASMLGGWWLRVGAARQILESVDLALSAYERANGLFATAATLELDNPRWQHDVSISSDSLGDVRQNRGDLSGALYAYAAAKDVRDKLAAADPGDAGLQHDLSISWNKLGEVSHAQGYLADALQAYNAAKEIADRLATAEPEDVRWKRGRFVSCIKLGEIYQAQFDFLNAFGKYTEAKDICDQLQRMNPANAELQRDLSVSWGKVGEVQQIQGDFAGALRSYNAATALFEKLAAVDPTNALWQRDLIVSRWKIADLLEQMPGGNVEAKLQWSQALALARTLADSGRLAPTDASFVEALEHRLAAATAATDSHA